MSLDKILQSLEAEAAQQMSEIERAAEAEIERVRAEAETTAAARRARHRLATQPRLQADRARILNQARLEALRTVIGAREAMLKAALEAAAACLEAETQGERYSRVLEDLACEALMALGEGDAPRLRVRPEDAPLMARIAQQRGWPVTVEGGDIGENAAWNCRGGVVAISADGRIRLANTLAARLQRVGAIYRSEIAARLFDQGR